MSKVCISIFKHNIYVRIAIYMSNLQYILLNCNIYVYSLQNICPSRCMGFRFIPPRFNVIFDIYIAGAASTYISACKLMQTSGPVSREG